MARSLLGLSHVHDVHQCLSFSRCFRSPLGFRMMVMIIVIKREASVKVRASIKSLKNQPGSQVVKRKGRVYVINKLNPRFKGRQG